TGGSLPDVGVGAVEGVPDADDSQHEQGGRPADRRREEQTPPAAWTSDSTRLDVLRMRVRIAFHDCLRIGTSVLEQFSTVVLQRADMPKVVDHEQRRRELAEAVWRVIRRNGVDGASVRTVAQEAGWSAGALRHYFRTQSELLDFAIELAAERIRQRVGALELADDPRRAVEQLLSELLPLDDERRAENEVWLAFTARALIDPQLRVRSAEIDDALRAASLRAVEMLGLPAGRERALEAERLHALLDGLALHAAMHPVRLPQRRILSPLRRHLDEQDGKASLRGA